MYLNKVQNTSFHLIKKYRLNVALKLIGMENKTILDIGCQDFYTYNRLKDDFDITLADIHPKHAMIKRENIESLSFEDKSFDAVLCMEVLEHTHDPVKAIIELTRITRRELIISVPNEPFFSLFRFLIWEKEHLWSITPNILKYYLGHPAFEKKIFLRRYYLAKWSL
jgi:ubiquinone/menaquinone biosynthesis C-methylase UbiE